MTGLEPRVPAERPVTRPLWRWFRARPGTCLLMAAAAVGLVAATLLGAPLLSVFLVGLVLWCPLLAWGPYRDERRAVASGRRGEEQGG